jgi:hypothetical protein
MVISERAASTTESVGGSFYTISGAPCICLSQNLSFNQFFNASHNAYKQPYIKLPSGHTSIFGAFIEMSLGPTETNTCTQLISGTLQ